MLKTAKCESATLQKFLSLDFNSLTKVRRKTQNLLADQHKKSIDGGVAKNFVPVDFVIKQVLGNIKVFTGLGNIHFIALHWGMVRVMTVMRNPPREVRSPQEWVGDLELLRVGPKSDTALIPQSLGAYKSDQIINSVIDRESSMSALAQNEWASLESAERGLYKPHVQLPRFQ